MSIIKNDFVLLSGDVIANIDLKRIVAAHKQRCKEDKSVPAACLLCLTYIMLFQ